MRNKKQNQITIVSKICSAYDGKYCSLKPTSTRVLFRKKDRNLHLSAQRAAAKRSCAPHKAFVQKTGNQLQHLSLIKSFILPILLSFNVGSNSFLHKELFLQKNIMGVCHCKYMGREAQVNRENLRKIFSQYVNR